LVRDGVGREYFGENLNSFDINVAYPSRDHIAEELRGPKFENKKEKKKEKKL
jgi:hypothetical protein